METNKVPSQRGNVHRFMIAVTTVLCIACVVYVWLFTTSVFAHVISIVLIFVGPDLVRYGLRRAVGATSQREPTSMATLR